MSSLGPERKCRICFRPAYCNNYGALSCDACKMFFRRIIKEKLCYVCKENKQCFENFNGERRFPNCKECRFRRCHEIGMVFTERPKKAILELKNGRDDDVSMMVNGLLYADKRRADLLATCFTVMNPSLQELVENRQLRMFIRPRDKPMEPADWSFFALYTTAEFLLELDVMKEIETRDQIVLLASFTGQASLLAGAMRTYRQKGDRLMTVDGKEVYPEQINVLLKLSKGEDHFLHRIRSLVVSRLIELKITSEEYILVTIILFCNPGIRGLSESAKAVITDHQKTLSSVLLQYCQLRYQSHGPSRFMDVLSLCHVIRRNFEDVQYLTMIFQMMVPGTEYKKLLDDVISDKESS